MSLSSFDRRTIAAHAADIYDRVAAVTPARAATIPSAPDPSAVKAIRAWNQAFSPGDERAFLQRLEWDGLDLGTVLAAASDPDVLVAEPPWTAWLDRASDAARGVAAEVSSGRFAPDLALNVPFEEVWSAFRRAASAAVNWPDAPGTLTADASAALERQLCVELTRQGELALFEYFQRTADVDRPSAADESPDARYRKFVVRLLEQGLAPFFLEYASLARRLAGLTRDWVESTQDFLDRLEQDRPEFTLLFGADPGALVSVEPGVSDPHHGRRRVAIVRFASGHRLVYKPRTLRLEATFNRFLQWMNAGLAVPVRVLGVLDRDTHGWVEFASHEPAPDREAAARYFHCGGALMCVAYLLGAQDLHMENVVATTGGPVLVDTEMLLQPVPHQATRVGDAVEPPGDEAPDETALDSGLLSLIDVTADGEVYDSGGLRGETRGPLPFPARVWRALATDALHYVEEPAYSTAGRHQVLLAGVPQDAGDYAEALVAGFTNAYRSLLDRRRELLAADGPLAAFAESAARVVLRPTNQYAMLGVVLSGPKYQRGGVAPSTAADVLHRAWAGAPFCPELWPAAIEERRAIDRLDVPYLSVRCDGTDLLCEGRVVVDRHYARSGLSAASARAQRWSAEDLETQANRLARTLGESVRSRFAGPAPRSGRDEDRMPAFAHWIARELLARADRTGEGLTWRYRLSVESSLSSRHRLYDGTLGPALFFAALAATSGDPAWRREALAALRPIQLAIERQPLASGPAPENIGGLDGLGSMVYGLTVASSLLDEPQGFGLARRVADRIGTKIETEAALDVIDGTAGAALGLLALFEVTGDRDVLRLAVACGDHLLHRANEGLPAPPGAPLVGFAHGAAGTASALVRLFQATSDERFRNAAILGCQFVADQFLPAAGNYAIAGPTGEGTAPRRRTMLAWCHGAPGILLGLSPALDICAKTAILSQFEAAIQTTARDEPAQVDHVCCGAFGRVEALLAAGRALGRSELVGHAWRLAGAVVARAEARGHFRLCGPGVEYRVFDPGFFRGLAGIGYGLLRLASPDRLPSIAGLEPPGRADRRDGSPE